MPLPLYFNGGFEIVGGQRFEVIDGRLVSPIHTTHATDLGPFEACAIFRAIFLDCNATPEQRRAWVCLTSGQRRTAQRRAAARMRKGSRDTLEIEASELDKARQYAKQLETESDERLASLRVAVGMPDGATWSHSYCCSQVHEMRGAEIEVRKLWGRLHEAKAPTAPAKESTITGDAGTQAAPSAEVRLVAIAIAPGEALDLTGIIARVAAYRRHSIELAAIRAAVDTVVHTEAAGVDPFPWEACEDAVNAPHEKVCALLEAINASADVLAKVRKPIEELPDEQVHAQRREAPAEPMTVAQVEAWLIANGCVAKSQPSDRGGSSTSWDVKDSQSVMDFTAYAKHGYKVCWTGPSESIALTLDAIERVLGRRPS